MKRTYTLLIVTVILALYASCEKVPHVKEEPIDPNRDTSKVFTVSFPAEVEMKTTATAIAKIETTVLNPDSLTFIYIVGDSTTPNTKIKIPYDTALLLKEDGTFYNRVEITTTKEKAGTHLLPVKVTALHGETKDGVIKIKVLPQTYKEYAFHFLSRMSDGEIATYNTQGTKIKDFDANNYYIYYDTLYYLSGLYLYHENANKFVVSTPVVNPKDVLVTLRPDNDSVYIKYQKVLGKSSNMPQGNTSFFIEGAGYMNRYDKTINIRYYTVDSSNTYRDTFDIKGSMPW